MRKQITGCLGLGSWRKTEVTANKDRVSLWGAKSVLKFTMVMVVQL